MALYLGIIHKAINVTGYAFKWSNRYFVDAPDTATALAHLQDIWTNGERLFHSTACFAYEFYVNLEGDTPYTPGESGTPDPETVYGLWAGGGDAMPIFNVVRTDFAVAASRDSRKFYRPPLSEGDQSGGNLTVGLAAEINEGTAYIASRAFMRDVDGQALTGSRTVHGITSRRVGKTASVAVPAPPPVPE